ncbi:glypican-3-like [Entelurus aequoreus]|uniref:glypican-3-like n=1 Tax=Entelurus aequoreus TaxID=161455 RepID=UPI002B1E065C|nr:glypican-3-like [Entelurus aequoreus]
MGDKAPFTKSKLVAKGIEKEFVELSKSMKDSGLGGQTQLSLKEDASLLRMVAVSEKRWRARTRAGGADGWSDDGEEGFESGDCDDEDECTGVSGLGPPPRRKRLRVFADLADNLAMDDFTFQEQLLTPPLSPAGKGGISSLGAAARSFNLVLTSSMTLSFLLLCRH